MGEKPLITHTSFIYFPFIWRSVLPAYVYKNYIHVWFLQRPVQGVGAPGTRVYRQLWVSKRVLEIEPRSSEVAVSNFNHEPSLQPNCGFWMSLMLKFCPLSETFLFMLTKTYYIFNLKDVLKARCFSSLCLCLSVCVRERQRDSVSCLSIIYCGLFFVLHFSRRTWESTASVPLCTVISAQDLQWNLELNMPLPEDKFTLALSVLGNDSLKRWKLHSTTLAQPSTGGGLYVPGLALSLHAITKILLSIRLNVSPPKLGVWICQNHWLSKWPYGYTFDPIGEKLEISQVLQFHSWFNFMERLKKLFSLGFKKCLWNTHFIFESI